MKFYLKSVIIILTGIIFFSACENIDPFKDEQYFKKVYIVGASSVVSSVKVAYNTGLSDAFLSVAASGTLSPDKDINVTLQHDDKAISWYNNKYMIDAPVKYQQLDQSMYEIPSMTATIKAGEVYGRLPFKINTSTLHCDSLYALTFKIRSVSEYEKTERDTVLILNLSMVNDYSGSYQLDIVKSTVKTNATTGELETSGATTLSATRTLKAVDSETVRFFNEAKNELVSGYSSGNEYFNAIEKYCVIFKKADGNTFTVGGWGSLNVVTSECGYSNGTFTFKYDYMDGTTRYRIEGTLRK